MVESEKAGVLFTVNPVAQNQEEMQINASYGLGESVVSGRVTADSYLCSKQRTVKSFQIGSKETQIILLVSPRGGGGGVHGAGGFSGISHRR